MVLSLQGLFNEMLALFQAGNQWNMSRLNKKNRDKFYEHKLISNFAIVLKWKKNFKKPKKPYRWNWSFESVHL